MWAQLHTSLCRSKQSLLTWINLFWQISAGLTLFWLIVIHKKKHIQNYLFCPFHNKRHTKSTRGAITRLCVPSLLLSSSFFSLLKVDFLHFHQHISSAMQHWILKESDTEWVQMGPDQQTGRHRRSSARWTVKERCWPPRWTDLRALPCCGPAEKPLDSQLLGDSGHTNGRYHTDTEHHSQRLPHDRSDGLDEQKESGMTRAEKIHHFA